MSDAARENPARVPEIIEELHDLTCNLRNALERFRLDARLNDLAEKEIPDARARLTHVLKLTDAAAHRTLDLVEQSGPLAEGTAREAAELGDFWARFRQRQLSPEEFRALLERMDDFLSASRTNSNTVRANLAEVLLAQGYQDLSGQIIRSVITLVCEVEKTLAELTRLAHGGEPPAASAHEPACHSGPAVPGINSSAQVVNDQQDVDALLSNLGM